MSQELVALLKYKICSNEVFAVLSDPYGGSPVCLTKQECEKRLVNLKAPRPRSVQANNLPYQDTQSMLNDWPKQEVIKEVQNGN
ncbi:MAG: hypothetical protein HYW77_02150 [Parcubacteria group bacterium]|nr:hypothetical protein [Parcubacteria group bacterium]